MCSTNVAKHQRLWCRRSSSAPSANLQPAHIVEHRRRPEIGLSPSNLRIAHGKPHAVSGLQRIRRQGTEHFRVGVCLGQFSIVRNKQSPVARVTYQGWADQSEIVER